jgi:hypothetical protein
MSELDHKPWAASNSPTIQSRGVHAYCILMPLGADGVSEV